MSRIPFINIADTECWMVYLMPFDSEERTDYDKVLELQQECIDRRIFGMGWDADCLRYGALMTSANVEKYIEAYNSSGWKVSERIVSSYQRIRKGHYVVTRLKNGHYYVGKVSSDGAFYMHRKDDPVLQNISWGCEVEQWIEYEKDSDIPSEIAGRFSQRLHSTIQRILPYRQRLLTISMYESALGNDTDQSFEIPKLNISSDNFTRSMTYMELEDLVSLLIDEKHHSEGYRLMPSSCKVSQQNYEFRFECPGGLPITCQVKNQAEVPIDHYLAEDGYEMIYLFSGMWSEDEAWNMRDEYIFCSNLYIIAPSELFDVLRRNRSFSNMFYDYEADVVKPEDLPLDGYTKKKRPCHDHDYSLSEGFACFRKSDGLFYSAEFGALILSRHILDDHEEELRLAEQICGDLNRDKE